MIHTMRLEGDDRGWRVMCSCGWDSWFMGGLGDAWTTMQRGLEDVGHKAFAAALVSKSASGDTVIWGTD